MAFKIPEKRSICPDDPESLFRDLRKKTVPGLLSHQADLLRSYLAVHTNHSDIALQLPTGSGKTLVGLLIAEWRRRKYGEREVYLCPTRQLVNQVAQQATGKYGIDVHAFTGSKANYDAQASSEWMNAEAVAITTYSSLFNTNPFFDEPNLIILDDAHSAENYVSSFWSLLIERSQHAPAFAALAGVVTPLLPASDRSRMAAGSDTADQQWVEKLPTPVFQSIVPEIVALLDEHIDLLNLGVEVENMHSLGSLAFEDRTNLGLEEPQLPRIDRSRAIDGNRDFARAFAHNAGQIETGPDVAAVGPHPTRIGWDGVGPETAQQFPPINLGFRRTFKSPLETGGYFASLLGDGRSLIDGDLPSAHLFLDAWRIVTGLWRVDHLTDAALALWNRRCPAFIPITCRIVRVGA